MEKRYTTYELLFSSGINGHFPLILHPELSISLQHVVKSQSGRSAICGEPDGAASAHHGHRHDGRQPQLRQLQRAHHQAKEVVKKPSFKLETF